MNLSPYSKIGRWVDAFSVYAFIIGEVVLFCLLIVLVTMTCILVVK